jgi:HAD superfamily hydrolase (TIGR01549 family)
MGGVLMEAEPRFTRLEATRYAVETPEVRAFLGPDFDLTRYVADMDAFVRKNYYGNGTSQPDAWRALRDRSRAFLGRDVPYEILRTIFWRYVDYMMSCFHLKDDVLDVLRFCSRQGYRMGVISNVLHPSIIYKELFTRWGIIDFFHPLVFSSDLLFKKPDVRIFQYALSAHPDLSAENCLFIGDTYETDIEGAHRAGMKAIWLNPSGSGSNPLNVPVIRSLAELQGRLPENPPDGGSRP